jgi:xanthine dehydrogenase accessory factor
VKELLELSRNARTGASRSARGHHTLLGVEGSSYRQPGARMWINVHGRVAGSVSGGYLEKNIIAEGQGVYSPESLVCSFL